MGRDKVTIRGELKQAGKGLLQEACYQIFGHRPKVKPKTQGGGAVHIHYHFYRDKKKPQPR